jgi:hypothetical protein
MNQAAKPAIGNITEWQWLYKLATISAIVGVAVIPLQIIIYLISPPPTAIEDWFNLFQNNALLGLLNLDLLYLLNNILLVPIYLALYLAMKPIAEAKLLMAVVLGLLGIAAYFPSNIAFEMLALSEQYRGATDAQAALLLAAGQALIVKYVGSAFLVYYILNALALLLFAVVMLQSKVFGRNTAYAGIVSGLLMLVPSMFGTIGLLFAFASLLPWALFSILIARQFFRLGWHPEHPDTDTALEK